jgi:hypothetical protein
VHRLIFVLSEKRLVEDLFRSSSALSSGWIIAEEQVKKSTVATATVKMDDSSALHKSVISVKSLNRLDVSDSIGLLIWGF